MPRFLRIVFYIGMCFFAGAGMVFEIDRTFSEIEVTFIKAAQNYWNRYTTHHACVMSIQRHRTLFTYSNTIPTYDNVYTIRGDVTRPSSDTFTVIRSLVTNGVRVVQDIDINVNLLYLRKCPLAFFPFLIHEFGHVLGLPHNTDIDSIMNITSAMPACKTYDDIHYLSGVDIYNWYNLLGGRCLVKQKLTSRRQYPFGRI